MGVKINEQDLEMKCPACQHEFSSIIDEKAFEEMAIYCPNCNIKINLDGINTTTGPAVRWYIPNIVINEHIAMMKDKGWKKKGI